MNIKITHNWLLDYLDTDATPQEIQKYLSLSGPSVERLTQENGDYVYDLEITTNRIDSSSVIGIAQEAYAILPQFGKKAELKNNPLKKYKFSSLSLRGASDEAIPLSLNIKIDQPELCYRFTAIVLSNITLKPSPDFITKRLQLVGIKSINNVVDISNYLMVALGQPTHVFDYDKVGKLTMIMRESKKGEKITTLDEKEVTLPGKDIIIEDGDGNLIDLCGIMGGLNSCVTKDTKNIILFVQTYNKHKIRKTSMTTGQRTVAATYFEKGLDPERVEAAVVYGVELLEKYASAKINSQLFDIYPNPVKTKTIKISQKDIDKIIGVEIKKTEIESILKRLDFGVQSNDLEYIVTVPTYRNNDVSIKEDIIEEIARVYGYYNLPDNIQTSSHVPQPEDLKRFYTYQQKIKYFLKHLGLNEVQNYSMVSKKQILDLNQKPEDFLRLTNSVSEELEYLRISLYPSLIKNIKDNTGRKNVIRLFEIAKVYLPKKDDLPNELFKLGFALNTNYSDLKGIIEALLKELNIKNFEFRSSNYYLFSNIQSELFIAQKSCGFLGQYADISLSELDFAAIIGLAKLIHEYTPINPYAVIKLDWTTEITSTKNFALISQKACSISKLLSHMEIISVYQNKITIRFYFTSNKKNIAEEEAKRELKKIQGL